MTEPWSHPHVRAGRVGFAYVALFAVNAAGIAWLPVWLASRGLGGEAVGLVIAASMLARVVATPAAGVLADAGGHWRGVLVASAAALLLAYALFPLAEAAWAFALVALVMGVGIGPAVPLLESANVRLAQQGGPAFGPMRAFGSLAFILTTIALGELVGTRGPDAVIVWSIAGSVAFLLAALVTPVPRSTRTEPRPRAPILPAMLAPPMVLALAASMLIQSSHALYYGFASLLWRDQGLSDGVIGALWAWSAVIEIGVLLAARRMERVGAPTLLMIGAACAVGRWALMALAPGLAGLILLQALHAATFAVAHLGFVHFVRDHAPGHVAATAQGVNSALTFGAGLAAATAFSGLLYERLGSAGYWAMALLALAGLVLAAMLRTRPALIQDR